MTAAGQMLRGRQLGAVRPHRAARAGRALGYRGLLRDRGDYHDETAAVAALLAKSPALTRAALSGLPDRVDNRVWCSPVEDQGALGSCTAQAAVSMVEYFQRRAHGEYIEGSRLALYWFTRYLQGDPADLDGGAYLRTTMKALRHYGVIPEAACPYDPDDYARRPPYEAMAQGLDYKPTAYFRLDPAGRAADIVLGRLEEVLFAGLPVMFGFTVYSSMPYEDGSEDVPFPGPRDRAEGGHAVLAVGYDRARAMPGTPAPGALLCRNSWGGAWGDGGYFWLPYDFVRAGLAADFWTLVHADFVSERMFE